MTNIMKTLFEVFSFMFLCTGAVGAREGWKTYGNGYFVYKARTDFNKTNRLFIEGTFSTMPNPANRFTLLAVYDAHETFAFQLLIKEGHLSVAYPAKFTEVKDWPVPLINAGYAFHFNVTVHKNNTTAGDHYNIETAIRGALVPSVIVVPDGKTFNYSAITLKIGGNLPVDPVGATLFKGCLSDIKFQGVDIIRSYFKQYPSNLNPVRGKQTFEVDGHKFSNVSQICNDTMSTSKPTTTKEGRTTTFKSKSTESTVKVTNTVNATSTAQRTTRATNVPSGGKALMRTIFVLIYSLIFAYTLI